MFWIIIRIFLIMSSQSSALIAIQLWPKIAELP